VGLHERASRRGYFYEDRLKKSSSSSSWQMIGKWYDQTVGEEGHYYHQAMIIPHVLRALNFSIHAPASLLDLGCGQGVLSRHLPPNVSYVGIDIAHELIAAAKRYRHPPSHQFIQGDVTQQLPLQNALFSHATLLLALQNIEHPLLLFKNASRYLQKGAPLIIVLNHPCFRIPRQSSWKVDDQKKMQYRCIDRYMSAMKIPIQAHPSKGKSSFHTLSFHHPLSDYSRWLKEAGFVIELIEEWCSDKVSEGGAAKMENRARQEIPLFMALSTKRS